MNIGILKDLKGGRVLITPETAKSLIKQGHNIYFASGCAIESGYTDKDYENVNSIKKSSNEDVLKSCELITSYRMPTTDVLSHLTKKHTLLAYSNIVKNKIKANTISLNGASLLGIEYIEKNNQKHIACKIGELVSHVAYNMTSYFYNKPIKGSGQIVGNLPFLDKTNVTILGYGNVGKELAKIFISKNCAVSVFDKDLFKFDAISGTNISYFSIENEKLEKSIEKSDIVISAISSNLQPTKRFITKEIVEKMKPNSLILDLSINQGGTFESSKETTLNDPIYLYQNIMHCCPTDILQYTGKSFSDYISHHLSYYIILLAEGYNSLSCFSNSLLIDKGTIKRDISFIETEEEDLSLITDPFDLMDEEISVSWKYADDANEILEELDDYEHQM